MLTIQMSDWLSLQKMRKAVDWMPEYFEKHPEPASPAAAPKPLNAKPTPVQKLPSPIRTKAWVYDVTFDNMTYRVTLPEPLPTEKSGKLGPKAVAKLQELIKATGPNSLLPKVNDKGKYDESDPDNRVQPRADVVALGKSDEAKKFNRPKSLYPQQIERIRKNDPDTAKKLEEELNKVRNYPPHPNPNIENELRGQLENLKKKYPNVSEDQLLDNKETTTRVDTFGDRYRIAANSSQQIDIVAVAEPKTKKKGG